MLPTIRFCLPSARRGIIKQTESHAVKIAIFQTQTMDARHTRALTPYLLMESPTIAAFRQHDPQTSAVLRFLTDHFGNLLILTAPGGQSRTTYLFHRRLSPIMAATCDYTSSADKNQRYEIVKSQNRVSNFVVP